MARQEHFPPRGRPTRKVFIIVIAALSVAMIAGAVIGPSLVVADGVDPRPFVAVISAVTVGAMFLVVGWMVWMVFFRPRR